MTDGIKRRSTLGKNRHRLPEDMFVRDFAARPLLSLGDKPTAPPFEVDHTVNTITEAPQGGGPERK